MRKNMVIFAILTCIIIPFCISKMYTFNLVNVETEEYYTPFYVKGNSLLAELSLETDFALSFFSPVIGYYLASTPFDYSEESGSPSLLDFDDILNMGFGNEGKKLKGTIKLTDADKKEVAIKKMIAFSSSDARSMKEDAMNSLGLAYSVSDVNVNGFEKSESTLNLLADKLSIKKVFSIQPWTKTKYNSKSKFTSKLCLGETHGDFSDTENVGSCSIANEDSPFWNCQFSQMIINNLNISLTNPKTEKPYEIRFIIESKNIVFPIKLKNQIAVKYSSTGSQCYIDSTIKKKDLLLCYQMTEDDEETIPITFINAEETMRIKGEIDNENYLSYWGDDVTAAFPTNIYFSDIDYIIMPLTVFKKFHVLFDAENNKISFFSEDKSLLKLIEKKDDGGDGNDETDNLSYFKNHIFTTILIIAIACLVIGLMVSICCSGKNAPTSIKIEGPINEDE